MASEKEVEFRLGNEKGPEQPENSAMAPIIILSDDEAEDDGAKTTGSLQHSRQLADVVSDAKAPVGESQQSSLATAEALKNSPCPATKQKQDPVFEKPIKMDDIPVYKGSAELQERLSLTDLAKIKVEPRETSISNVDQAPQSKKAPQTAPKKKDKVVARKTAKEYWQREDEEFTQKLLNLCAGAIKKPNDSENGSQASGSKRRKGENGVATPASASKAGTILQSRDQVTARASMVGMSFLDPIAATTKADLLQEDVPGADRLVMASRGFGRNKCILDKISQEWKVPGMKCRLRPHQVLGVCWMLGRELMGMKPLGGILADQMGLGKTVQMLACMASNPPSKGDKKKMGSTLIVTTAVDQWISEIKQHSEVDEPLRIRGKEHRGLPLQNVRPSEIVVTSYEEVMRSFPSGQEAMDDFEKMKRGEWIEKYKKELRKSGMLFLMDWHRVVLDEAHKIKNADTRTSIACRALKSKYRWALTGTPIQNYCKEIYPYLHFLGTEWPKDRAEFTKALQRRTETGKTKLIHEYISYFFLKRECDDMFLFRPILDIPTPYAPVTVWLDMPIDEQIIYKTIMSALFECLKKEKCSAEDEGKSKKENALVVFRRACQMISHAFAAEGFYMKWFDESGLQLLADELRAHQCSIRLLDQIHRVVLNRPFPQDAEASNVSQADNAQKQVERAAAILKEDGSQLRCLHASCNTPQLQLHIGQCKHALCRHCFEVFMDETEVEGDDRYPCPVCARPGRWTAPEEVSKPTMTGEAGFTGVPFAPKGSARKGKKQRRATEREIQPGVDLNGVVAKPQGKALFLKISDNRSLEPIKEPIKHSAKTAATMFIIEKWQSEAPEDKIIVFTQSRYVMGILARSLSAKNIDFLYFEGGMNPEQKGMALEEFRTNPKCKILIAGLMSGGQAYNMTCANRVILVDPWWNTSIERQAFGRVHRLGQKKICHFVRLMMKDSIDEGIHRMHQEKDAVVEGVTEGSTGRNLSLEFISKVLDGMLEKLEVDWTQPQTSEDMDFSKLELTPSVDNTASGEHVKKTPKRKHGGIDVCEESNEGGGSVIEEEHDSGENASNDEDSSYEEDSNGE